MIIPTDRISAEALQGLVEEFITRDGTDYGEYEVALTDKVAEVSAQLSRGEVVVVYDTVTESVSLQTRQQALASEREQAYSNDADAEYQQWAYEEGNYGDS